jgi:hypothetical protein
MNSSASTLIRPTANPIRPSLFNRRLSALKWLEGRWVYRNGTRRGEERWIRRDNSLHGHSYELDGTRTVFAEKLTIEAEGDAVRYHATPGGLPVTFELTALAEGLACFKRTTGDAFPQYVTYTRQDDRLTLTLTGRENGRVKRLEVNWVHVPVRTTQLG